MTRRLDRKSDRKPKYDSENPWIEALKTLGVSAVLAFGIRAFVAEARYIPSGSMMPTLQINDRLIVDKIGYRFQEPKRGDIVVFAPTKVLEQKNFRDAFIKRIIGLPGDIVAVRQGRVYVNERRLKEDYIAEAPDYEWGPVRVSEDSYLVLGDNRNNSYDSHCWGFVPRDRIIGRAIVRFWPLDRIGELGDKPLYVPVESRDIDPSALPSPQTQLETVSGDRCSQNR